MRSSQVKLKQSRKQHKNNKQSLYRKRKISTTHRKEHAKLKYNKRNKEQKNDGSSKFVSSDTTCDETKHGTSKEAPTNTVSVRALQHNDTRREDTHPTLIKRKKTTRNTKVKKNTLATISGKRNKRKIASSKHSMVPLTTQTNRKKKTTPAVLNSYYIDVDDKLPIADEVKDFQTNTLSALRLFHMSTAPLTSSISPIPNEVKQKCLDDFNSHLSNHNWISTCATCGLRSIETRPEVDVYHKLHKLPSIFRFSTEETKAYTDTHDDLLLNTKKEALHIGFHAVLKDGDEDVLYHLDPDGIKDSGVAFDEIQVILCTACSAMVEPNFVPTSTRGKKLFRNTFPLTNFPRLDCLPSDPCQLSIVEKMAISIVVPYFSCYKLSLNRSSRGSASQSQNAIKGHVICMTTNAPQAFETMVNVLPRNDLVEHIKLVFISDSTDQKAIADRLSFRAQNSSHLRCNVHLIHEWIIFLKKHNPFYADIHISEENLKGLEKDVQQILDTPTTVVGNAASSHEHSTGSNVTHSQEHDVTPPEPKDEYYCVTDAASSCIDPSLALLSGLHEALKEKGELHLEVLRIYCFGLNVHLVLHFSVFSFLTPYLPFVPYSSSRACPSFIYMLFLLPSGVHPPSSQNKSAVNSTNASELQAKSMCTANLCRGVFVFLHTRLYSSIFICNLPI